MNRPIRNAFYDALGFGFGFITYELVSRFLARRKARRNSA